jgi:dolichol-phosphate mannosyltransferase
MSKLNYKIAVVIPCFNVKKHVINVLKKIPKNISKIYVIDDKCPEETGEFVKLNIKDKRLKIITHKINLGVGAAVISGYREAIKDNIDIVVKIDGDGQMDPSLIPSFIMPIIYGQADYTKGNRFYNLEEIMVMPKKRIFGNAVLSFINKISSGYWNIFDPTNGFTAIHADVIRMLPLNKISKRYFFESDTLFRLNIIKAVVEDVPMHANYDNESSNLKIWKILPEFFTGHIRNTFKRIFYNYYLRDMSIASFELPLGFIFLIFGFYFGFNNWDYYSNIGEITPPGTVMISAISILVGIQFILAFINFDINSIPKKIRHKNEIFN